MVKKKGRISKVKKVFAWVGVGVLLCLLGTYFIIGNYFNKHFFPNVIINGRDVSSMTAEQVKESISKESQTYALHIHTKDGGEEILYGADFGLRLQYDDNALAEILAGQQFWKWGLHLFKTTEYEMTAQAEYDENALKEQMGKLACINPRNMTAPEDAYLSYNAEEGFHIVPEVEGNEINIRSFKEQVIEAVNTAKTDISLEELGLYTVPKVTQEDEALIAEYQLWKPYMDTKIVYCFDDITETLDASIFFEWMSIDSNDNVTFDREKIEEYVKSMAKRYNTAYSPKVLETSYGETVTISNGPYGWLVNQAEEADALEAALLACESQEREPIYRQTAASHIGPDYGDTYVEINLSAQHLFFYKDGELLIESDFVSGNEARGWSTPAGAFPLTYKERNATLRGQGYVTPVSYWMPFNGNIGLHDSSWRSSYGRNIYKSNGSHGCINLPPAVAKTIYENIEKGMPVLCYYLRGTEYISSEPVNVEPEVPLPESLPNTVVPDMANPDSTLIPDMANPDSTLIPDTANPDSTVVPDVVNPDNTVIPDAVNPDSTVIPDVANPDNTVVPDAVVPAPGVPVPDAAAPEGIELPDTTIIPDNVAISGVAVTNGVE